MSGQNCIKLTSMLMDSGNFGCEISLGKLSKSFHICLVFVAASLGQDVNLAPPGKLEECLLLTMTMTHYGL